MLLSEVEYPDHSSLLIINDLPCLVTVEKMTVFSKESSMSMIGIFFIFQPGMSRIGDI
jgi:hypothetical protein